MTDAPHTEPSPEQPRRLTRSTSDGVIGGVASGLGKYFSLDPLLFRIGFVALSFAGGIGLLAYILLLAFVPTDGSERPGGTSKAAAIAGAVVLGVALVTFLGTPFFFFGPGLLVIAVVGLAGVVLWRALGADFEGDPGRIVGRIVLFGLLALAIAGAAIAVGLAAALGGGVVIGILAVVTGLVLIATAFVGGARWLIVPALALVLPLGFVAAAGIDIDGGVGDRSYHPANLSQLRETYQVGMGGLDVDLTDLDLPTGRTDVAVDVGIGDAVVYVPREACITSDIRIGAGVADVFDRDNSGLDVDVAEAAVAPTGRPQLHLEADVGAGAFEVVREGSLPDQFRHDRFGSMFDQQTDDPLEGGTGCT